MFDIGWLGALVLILVLLAIGWVLRRLLGLDRRPSRSGAGPDGADAMAPEDEEDWPDGLLRRHRRRGR